MAALVDAGNKTFEYILNGMVWTNCTTDADCPGRGRCAVNTTWSAHPTMCYCRFTFDHVGTDCLSLGAYGNLFVVSHSIMSAIAIVCFSLGVYCIVQLIRIHRFQLDAVSTSVVSSTLANLFTAIILAANIRFATFPEPPNPETDMKGDTSRIGAVTQAGSFFFSTISYLNISLVWIGIADSARHMKMSKNSNLRGYRSALIVYYVVFLGTQIVGLIIDNVVIRYVPAAFGAIFIIVSYILGYFKMRQMIQSLLINSQTGTSTGSNDATATLRKSYLLIQNAALGMSLSSLLFIVSIGIWVVRGGFGETPGSAANLVFQNLTWLGVTIANIVVIHYLFVAIQAKVRLSSVSSTVLATGGA